MPGRLPKPWVSARGRRPRCRPTRPEQPHEIAALRNPGSRGRQRACRDEAQQTSIVCWRSCVDRAGPSRSRAPETPRRQRQWPSHQLANRLHRYARLACDAMATHNSEMASSGSPQPPGAMSLAALPETDIDDFVANHSIVLAVWWQPKLEEARDHALFICSRALNLEREHRTLLRTPVPAETAIAGAGCGRSARVDCARDRQGGLEQVR